MNKINQEEDNFDKFFENNNTHNKNIILYKSQKDETNRKVIFKTKNTIILEFNSKYKKTIEYFNIDHINDNDEKIFKKISTHFDQEVYAFEDQKRIGGFGSTGRF